jgi:hypothetical protein
MNPNAQSIGIMYNGWHGYIHMLFCSVSRDCERDENMCYVTIALMLYESSKGCNTEDTEKDSPILEWQFRVLYL